jgi:hypothetical protein
VARKCAPPEAVTEFEWTVVQHPPCSPGIASSYLYIFDPLKDGLRGQHFSDDVLQNAVGLCLRLQRKGYMFLFRGGMRLLAEMENIFKSNCVFRNVVKFYAVFSVLHVSSIKNSRHYFITAPHSFG